MFDTITFALNKQYFDREKLTNHLNRKFKFNSQKEYLNGKTKNYSFNNWNFWLTDNYLNFSGSLTNLLLKNNYDNMSYSEVKVSLRLLENYLDISLAEAVIKRIDISYTMNMNNHVSEYLKILIPPKNCKIHIHGDYETVELEHKKVVNSKFYNKIKELADNKKSNQSGCINMLKYEMQIPCGVGSFFGINKFSFKHLFEVENYNKLIDKWYSNFLSIPFRETSSISHLDCSTAKCFQIELAMEAVRQRGGLEAIDNILREKNICKQVRFKIRKFLRTNYKALPNPCCLKNELNDKIFQGYQNALVS